MKPTGRVLVDVLEEMFLNLIEARYVVDRWRMAYNHHRPHSRLNRPTPAAFTARWSGCRRPRVPPGSASGFALRATPDKTPDPPEPTENVLA